MFNCSKTYHAGNSPSSSHQDKGIGGSAVENPVIHHPAHLPDQVCSQCDTAVYKNKPVFKPLLSLLHDKEGNVGLYLQSIMCKTFHWYISNERYRYSGTFGTNHSTSTKWQVGQWQI
jgi:hypothetical protein